MMRQQPPRRSAAFTLIELLVVIAIIAVLAGILFPVFSSARAKGRQTTCISNQRQLSQAVTIYAQDWEKYPGYNWYGDIEGIREVVICPDKPDAQVGYGINGFMHSQRPDLVSNHSEVIVTSDADTTSTISCAYGRHAKGAVVSHLDGSARFALNNEQAGRFAMGKFPLQPIVVMGGIAGVEMPDYFRVVTDGEEIKKDFVIIGPYGDNTKSAKSAMNEDYIGEGDIARALGDVSPSPGMSAPEPSRIYDPISGTDTALASGDPLAFKTWTKVPGNDGLWSLQTAYNCRYFGRTTYAALYIYSEDEQMVTMNWWCDDTGKFWLNGETAPGWSEDENGAVGGPATKTFNLRMPQGISYMLFKITNNAAPIDYANPGGMKLKVSFTGLGRTLAVTGTLQ